MILMNYIFINYYNYNYYCKVFISNQNSLLRIKSFSSVEEFLSDRTLNKSQQFFKNIFVVK